jgi:hypothetical protein
MAIALLKKLSPLTVCGSAEEKSADSRLRRLGSANTLISMTEAY